MLARATNFGLVGQYSLTSMFPWQPNFDRRVFKTLEYACV